MSAHPSTGLLNPYFGIEIEIFLRLKPAVEENIKEKIRARKRLPDYWKTWDFNLENSQGDQRHEDKKMKQLARVGYAILDLLDQNLGEGHGWGMANDQSLKGDLLTEPSNPRKWWGAEIISPPLAAGSNWRADIKTVFASLGNVFDFWTNDYCSCHVHVSPGPKNNSKYTMSQLMQIAKGALFWEDALKQILPHERRTNRYAGPNWLAVARQEYMSVSCHGWKPVFDKISRLAARPTSTADFAKKMTIIEPDPNHPETRYLSTSFSPLARLGTVEFRRQAGVASAQTAIHRVLLALTLYTSAVNLNFDREGERYRKKHPDENALIDVLCRSLENNLPAKAGWGVDFRAWLEQCASDYESDEEYRRFGEREINEREGNMRRYGTVTAPGSAQPSRSSQPATRPAPSGHTMTVETREPRASGHTMTLEMREPRGQRPSSPVRRAPAQAPPPSRQHVAPAAVISRRPRSPSSSTTTRHPEQPHSSSRRQERPPTTSRITVERRSRSGRRTEYIVDDSYQGLGLARRTWG